jgi:hypothetical protein
MDELRKEECKDEIEWSIGDFRSIGMAEKPCSVRSVESGRSSEFNKMKQQGKFKDCRYTGSSSLRPE